MIQIEKTKVLIVEGNDEVPFLSALMRKCDLQGIQVINMEGNGNTTAKLKAVKLAPNFGTVVSLAIMRDAEEDAEGTFKSICSALKNVGLPVPARVGEPSRGNRPQVTVMVIPYGASRGMLEDVVLSSIGNDPIKACVDRYIECVKKTGVPLPNNLSKAKVHTFLAAQPRPGLRLGEAAEAGYWNFDHSDITHITQFLRSL